MPWQHDGDCVNSNHGESGEGEVVLGGRRGNRPVYEIAAVQRYTSISRRDSVLEAGGTVRQEMPSQLPTARPGVVLMELGKQKRRSMSHWA